MQGGETKIQEEVMASQTNQTVESKKMETENPPPKAEEPSSSCRKRVKDDNATFFDNLKDHVDEFIHASMDEHKTCFKNTMNKIMGTFSKTDEIHAPLPAAPTK